MIADYVFLFLVAAVAGAINSVAGGGTLLTFPALCVALGRTHPDLAVAAVWANATSTVALCPGSLAGMWGYREELRQTRQWIIVLIWPSLIGGYIGSKLVMVLPAETFKVLVPWLILTAALLFLLQPYIARWTGIGKPHATPSRGTKVGIICFQFLVAIYGGYFGAGIGILMLSSLALIGLSDIHQMNGLKTLLALAINGVSVAVFALDGKVDWGFALVMAVAAILGGYGGARVARRLNRNVVRGVVVAIGFSLATYYFYTTFFGPTKAAEAASPPPSPLRASPSSVDPRPSPSEQ